MSTDRAITSFSLVVALAAGFAAMTAVRRLDDFKTELHEQDVRMAAAPIEAPVEIEEPEVSFEQLVKQMVDYDLELARKEKTLTDAGYAPAGRGHE